MTDSPATDPTDDRSDAPTDGDRPLAESGESPERVEHVGVSEHDDVDQDALDIAESTSADEPPA